MKTARYKIISDSGGNRYQFFCGLSGALIHTTKPITADSEEEELNLAWDTEGRQYFDLCHSCGEWVTSAMYNADTLECVKCSPWESLPNYCPYCGKATKKSEAKCRRCGKQLQYAKNSE